MTLIPYDRKDIENIGGFKKTRNQRIVEEFVNSGMDCSEVKDFTHKTSHSCANALNMAAKRLKILSVHAISRNGRVFLIKTI